MQSDFRCEHIQTAPFHIYLLKHLSARVCRDLPLLQRPENDMLILLCYYALSPADAAVRRWVNSPRGISFYWQTVKDLKGQATMEQISLRVLALLSFERLCRFRPTEDLGPAFSCYLNDFCRLLQGERFSNSRTVLERMALSLERVGEWCHPNIYHFFVMARKGEILPLDTVSDNYWAWRTLQQLDHTDACQMVWGAS